MKKNVLVFCLICFAVGEAFAGGDIQNSDKGKVTIKLASLVPENTPWGAALNLMSKEWAKISNNEVELIVYHNGVAGSESDVIRKLKQNQIQAAVLTSFGINSINPDVMTLSVPFLIQNDKELDIVLNEVRSNLEDGIAANGFKLVVWSKAGWVRFFSKQPVYVPSDVKKQKLATNEEAAALTNAFKTMGYQLVPVDYKDVIIALNGGMIEAVFQSPVSAAAMQLFAIAKNMNSFKIAPFMGGIVMNNSGWSSIPEKYRDAIKESSLKVGVELDATIAQLEEDAIKAMKDYGLNITESTPAQMREWYTDIDKAMPVLFGATFDRALYERISAVLKPYR